MEQVKRNRGGRKEPLFPFGSAARISSVTDCSIRLISGWYFTGRFCRQAISSLPGFRLHLATEKDAVAAAREGPAQSDKGVQADAGIPGFDVGDESGRQSGQAAELLSGVAPFFPPGTDAFAHFLFLLLIHPIHLPLLLVYRVRKYLEM